MTGAASGRAKLVIWDDAWAPHAADFASQLDAGWEVASCAGDVGWLMSQLEDASALVAVQLPARALPRARGLRLFLFPGAGLLTPDPAAFPAGCPVVNVYEHEAPIAEYAMMAMLLHVTRLLPHIESFRAGRWSGSGRNGGVPHGELGGRTVGLLGYGHIGQAIAARARAFGMRVAAVAKDPPEAGEVQPDFFGGADQLAELLRQSDFLVIAAPLTPETRERIGAAELAMLPRNAMLINVSRAEIVCEQALYETLASGRLGGAALDVWYRYPAPGENGHGSRLPFHALPNVICTPHYSAWTHGMIQRRISRMAENLNHLSRGEPLERVVLTGTWRP